MDSVSVHIAGLPSAFTSKYVRLSVQAASLGDHLHVMGLNTLYILMIPQMIHSLQTSPRNSNHQLPTQQRHLAAW